MERKWYMVFKKCGVRLYQTPWVSTTVFVMCCIILYRDIQQRCCVCSYVAAGLWLIAITLHDVLEVVSLFGDLQRRRKAHTTHSLSEWKYQYSYDYRSQIPFSSIRETSTRCQKHLAVEASSLYASHLWYDVNAAQQQLVEVSVLHQIRRVDQTVLKTCPDFPSKLMGNVQSHAQVPQTNTGQVIHLDTQDTWRVVGLQTWFTGYIDGKLDEVLWCWNVLKRDDSQAALIPIHLNTFCLQNSD